MTSPFPASELLALNEDQAPQTASEFILTFLKLQIPICDLDDLVVDETGEPLGEGATLKVRRGSWKEHAVAVKTLNLEKAEEIDGPDEVRIIQAKHAAIIEAITREVRFLSYTRLQQERNIVPLLAISWTVEQELDGKLALYPMILMELQDCTLREYIESARSEGVDLSFELKASLIKDMISGLAVLHDHGLIHSDLKPENVLVLKLPQPTAKLGDFGSSTQTYYNIHINGSSIEWKSPESHEESLQPQAGRATQPTTESEIEEKDTNDEEQPLDSGSSSHTTQEQSDELHHDVLTWHKYIDYSNLEEYRARDIFSMGLVAFFVLKEVLPFADDERRARGDWLSLKKSVQGAMACWLADNLRSESAEDSAGEDSATPPPWDWEVRDLSSPVLDWVPVESSVPIMGIITIPGGMLSVDPGQRLSLRDFKKLFDLSPLRGGEELNAVSPLIDISIHRNEVPVDDIPPTMWDPLWNMLLLDAEEPNAPISLLDFIGECYYDGDGVEPDEETGGLYLFRAATTTSESKYHQVQVRQKIIIIYGTSGDLVPLPLEDKKEWMLDSIFLLTGGYWYALGYEDHLTKLEKARDSFAKSLAYLEEDEVNRALKIGLNLYTMRNPSEFDNKGTRDDKATLIIFEGSTPENFDINKIARIAALKADWSPIKALLENGVDPEVFLGHFLVRAVCHHGYEDSLRLLHRVDVLQLERSREAGSEIKSILIQSINNTTTTGVAGRPAMFKPPIFEAVMHHRFACLNEILRQNWSRGSKDKVNLNIKFELDEDRGLETPLHYCVRMLRPYLTSILLAYGADCNTADDLNGDMPLHTCCRTKPEDLGHWSDWWGTSYRYPNSVSSEDKQRDRVNAHRLTLELLLDSPGIDLNAQNFAGKTPLMLSLEAGNPKFMERLMECGAEMDDEVLAILAQFMGVDSDEE